MTKNSLSKLLFFFVILNQSNCIQKTLSNDQLKSPLYQETSTRFNENRTIEISQINLENYGVSLPTALSHQKDFMSLYGEPDIFDPLEPFNRIIFVVNVVVDRVFLRPISVIYGHFAPLTIKRGVSSALDNAYLPLTAFNYALQTEGDKSLMTIWRFIINSIFGVGGSVDVAQHLQLQKEDPQTIGDTLAYYGVGSGFYLVLPILGPSNLRDSLGTIYLNSKANLVTYPIAKYHLSAPFFVIDNISAREGTLKLDQLFENSIDAYIAVKSFVHQKRQSEVSKIKKRSRIYNIRKRRKNEN
jgi:phospholipid-binding lipoprotein MlaA